MTLSPPWYEIALDEWQSEPPVDWNEIESIEEQEAREQAENGDA